MTANPSEITTCATECVPVVAASSLESRNKFILSLIDELLKGSGEILQANRVDLAAAEKDGLATPLVRRMRFTQSHVDARIHSLGKIADLPDPLGVLENYRLLPSGLWGGKMSVPLGVIAMIYEARPHVTLNAAAFCVKSGNPCILKGGKETRCTNEVLSRVIERALTAAALPVRTVQLVTNVSHEWVRELVTDQRIDLVIPRGGPGLVKSIVETARVPVLKHYRGVCQAFVHAEADLDKAEPILVNSKCFMPEVCNALENAFVDASIADVAVPRLCEALQKEGVEIRGCARTRALFPDAKDATAEDFDTEYLDLVLSMAVVDGYDDALTQMRKHTSGHTEVIITEDQDAGLRFLREMDGGVVLLNASTMFNDGEELGLGAEIGISTDKLHARGPMGLAELTSRKWVIFGEGQTKLK